MNEISKVKIFIVEFYMFFLSFALGTGYYLIFTLSSATVKGVTWLH